MSTYNYRSLSPGCIRLLRLSPHEDDDAPIQCQLFEYSLASARRKGTHLYEALSYCWGSPTKSRTAFVDEGLLHITENLRAALLRLRDPALERIIWIDAICINQDDFDEKGQQVQLMAEIFARARCVIVWLENMSGDRLFDSESAAVGRKALQALEAAARSSNEAPPESDNEEEAPPKNDQNRLAVEKLLTRPWFRRIWVLQEVAAARHVLIVCKSVEIDGQAFCSGLNQISPTLLLENEDARSRIRSTVKLIKGAPLRPKGAVNASRPFSLQISSLGSLIELHHTREATDRRDKIYALLGMGIDTPAGLVPNYQMSWEELFPHLVKSLLLESISVATLDEHETALITIQGCVIGTVGSVKRENTLDSQQLVEIFGHRSDPSCKDSHRSDWTFQTTTTTRIYGGDTICLLRGSSLPTVVRAHQDYCSIVAIAIDTNVDMSPTTGSWCSNTQLDFLLVWSWKAETHPSNLNDFLNAQGLRSRSCVKLQTPDDWNTAVMLLETGQYYLAVLKLHSIIIASDDVGESGHPSAGAIAGFLDVVRKVFHWHETFQIMRSLIGRKRGYVDVTEDFLIQLASAPGWEPMAFVLDTQGKSVNITESVLVAIIENRDHGKSVMEVLLDRRECPIIVTEKCLRAAIADLDDTWDIIKLLLNDKAAQINITENVLIAVAANKSSGCTSQGVMGQLLDRQGNQVTITENVLVAAAANEKNGDLIMNLLLRWKEGHVTVTEKVLAAAATNAKLHILVLSAIFCRRTGDIFPPLVEDRSRVSNQALKTAYEILPDCEGASILYGHMKARGLGI